MIVTSGGHNELSNLIGQRVRNVEDNNKNRCVCVGWDVAKYTLRYQNCNFIFFVEEIFLHIFEIRQGKFEIFTTVRVDVSVA